MQCTWSRYGQWMCCGYSACIQLRTALKQVTSTCTLSHPPSSMLIPERAAILFASVRVESPAFFDSMIRIAYHPVFEYMNSFGMTQSRQKAKQWKTINVSAATKADTMRLLRLTSHCPIHPHSGCWRAPVFAQRRCAFLGFLVVKVLVLAISPSFSACASFLPISFCF